MKLSRPYSISELLGACKTQTAFQIEPFPPNWEGLLVDRVDAPEKSGPRSLSFISERVISVKIQSLQSKFVICTSDCRPNIPHFCAVENVRRALADILLYLQSQGEFPWCQLDHETHSSQSSRHGVIDPSAQIAQNSYIGPYVSIGPKTKVGPNTTLTGNVRIGAGCEIQAGVVVGVSGFGFYCQNETLLPILHPGGVLIQDDVWIGANTVICSGVLHPTIVESHCRLDSHIQIAHNVHLGHHGAMASQTGIAGSTTIGPFLTMGGASSIAGHLTIGERVTIAARSGVTKNIRSGNTVAGFPARPIKDWKRQQIYLKQKALN